MSFSRAYLMQWAAVAMKKRDTSTPPHWYSAMRMCACHANSANSAGRPPIMRFWMMLFELRGMPQEI